MVGTHTVGIDVANKHSGKKGAGFVRVSDVLKCLCCILTWVKGGGVKPWEGTRVAVATYHPRQEGLHHRPGAIDRASAERAVGMLRTVIRTSSRNFVAS